MTRDHAEVHERPPRRARWLAAALVLVASVAVAAVAVGVVSSQDDPGREETASPTPSASTPTSSTPVSSAPAPPASPDSDPEDTDPEYEQAGLLDESVLEPSETLDVTTDGAVIENLDVTGIVRIKADDVTLRNVRVSTSTPSYAIRTFSGYTGTTLENVEVALSREECSNAGIAGGSGTTVRLTRISGCGDGVKVASDSTYERNHIAMAKPSGAEKHLDGMQNSGASNVIIRENYIDVPASVGGNSAIFTHDYFNPIENVLIEGNYLNGGNYTVFVEGEERTTGVEVSDNRFGRDFRYGPVRFSAAVGDDGNVWDDTDGALE
jgi:hypothetical protein